MTEPISKKDRQADDRRAARRRLEELLADPGPGITVRRLGEVSPPRDAGPSRAAGDEPGPAASPLPASPPRSTTADLSPPSSPIVPTAPADGPSRAGPDSEPAARPVRTDPFRHLPEQARGKLEKLIAPDVAVAPRPLAAPSISPPVETGAAARIRDRVRLSGFFGMLLDWMLPQDSELKTAIAGSRRAFMATGLFSFVINVLMLAGPLFMLQVYDRVMTSGSVPTLVALSALTAALYTIIGVLELVRSRIIVRIGVEVDGRIADRVFRASLRRSLAAGGTATHALRDLDSLRQFLASPAPATFFDAPWTPIYLGVIFLMHWTLGVAAAIGAGILLFLAYASEARTRGPLFEAGKAAARSLELAETGQRNAESITAMGMVTAYRNRWQMANGESLAWQLLAADRLGGMTALSKTLRLLLQSMMLAIGAALALAGLISAGTIVAATIIFGRALAPVEQAIGHWRQFLKARESYAKLAELLTREPDPAQRTALPAPKGHVEVQALRVAAPDTRQLILANITFEVRPGEMLAVIGPSASGKSTLARAVVGLWPPIAGSIRLDGARLDQWSNEDLGRYIGYLPQNVELFAGSVRENISRFREDARDDDVIAAATQAHAHEMILALPNGYDTQLGNFGTYLSAGQRQRIGLARALFGNPALVVLDEPNSNLDRVGDEALSGAIDGMRKRGQAIILVSHRVQAIGKADLLLFIERGVQRAFGPRREVMKLFQGPSGADQQPTVAPAGTAAKPTGGA